MLKALSYHNITFAVIYFISYLLNSNSFTMIALLLIIVYNWLVIRNIEKELCFTNLHYFFGAACLVFSGFLTLWVINVIRSSIEHNYFANTWIYMMISIALVIGIVWQYALVLRCRK